MSNDAISPRQRRILLSLCRQYVVSGRPVASAALAHAGLDWSSATIRSELAALERAGLVNKPHSASGRVPTGEGWRTYVESLPRADARPEHQRLVDVSLGEPADPRLGLRATARLLSELSGCVAIGFVGGVRDGTIRALELVPLTGSDDSGRLLVMLGLADGSSSVRVIEADRALLGREGELRRLQDLLRELTLGRSLEQARAELRGLFDVSARRVDDLVAEALRIGMLLCVASFDPLFMQVAGHSSLLGPELIGAGEATAELLGLLEDYQRVAEILCQLLPEADDDPRASVRVDLGLERFVGHGAELGPTAPLLHVVTHEELDRRGSGLTLVGCRVRWPMSDRAKGPGTTAALALLGSPRMDYEAVIPLVEYAARAMAARG